MIRLNGHRGAFLILFGALHIVLGLSYANPETPETVQRSLGFLVHIIHLPVQYAAIVWIVSGVVAVIAAFRGPPGQDGWGFQALIAVEIAWSVQYLLTWVFLDLPRGYFLAAMFAALAGAVYIVSGMVSAGSILRWRDHP